MTPSSVASACLVAAVAVPGRSCWGLSLFVDPQFACVRTLRNAIEQQRSNFADTRKSGDPARKPRPRPIRDGPKKAELAGLQRQLAESDQRLAGAARYPGRSPEMNCLLERLLVPPWRSPSGLPADAAGEHPRRALQGEGKRPSSVAQERQFRHLSSWRVEMRLEGGIWNFGYLEQLKRPSAKSLGAVQLTVVAHPKARMTLTRGYTLGSTQDMVGHPARPSCHAP